MDFDQRLVSILAYCVMPNHFHLLLKQEVEGGISTYLRRLTVSFVRYYNILHKQKGPLFESFFKAVLIESENQLLHVSRYIHLNPTSAKLVNDPIKYPYCLFLTTPMVGSKNHWYLTIYYDQRKETTIVTLSTTTWNINELSSLSRTSC